MYRNKIKELIYWKLSEYRKPLIVLGARQVGKTWLIEEFGRQEYSQTVYINFEKMKAVRNLFAEDYDVKRILTALTVFDHKEINPANTLIVFDKKTGKINKADISGFCPDISVTTIERTLNELLKIGYINKTGSGKSTGYVKK